MYEELSLRGSDRRIAPLPAPALGRRKRMNIKRWTLATWKRYREQMHNENLHELRRLDRQKRRSLQIA